MSTSLVFYTHPQSRGRILRWMLEEVGQPYEVVVLNYGSSMKEPAYLNMNPMGKVPTLRHGDAVVTEVAACCAYLAQTFPESNLLPTSGDHQAWADYFRWMFFSAGPLEAAITNHSLNVTIPEDKHGMVGYGCYNDTIRTLLTAVLNKEFIAGKHFTAADVYVGSHIAYGLSFGMIPAHPALEEYTRKIKARPAAIRAEELDGRL